MCKCHVVLTPSYRRKMTYNQYQRNLQEDIKLLCKYKGVENSEGYYVSTVDLNEASVRKYNRDQKSGL